MDSTYGVKLLGCPLGTPAYVQQFLDHLLETHLPLKRRLPDIPQTQVAYVLLKDCVATRFAYAIRTLDPTFPAVQRACARHDASILELFELIAATPRDPGSDHIQDTRAQLPLTMGGLGLGSAARVSPAAYVAAAAECLHEVAKRGSDWLGPPNQASATITAYIYR